MGKQKGKMNRISNVYISSVLFLLPFIGMGQDSSNVIKDTLVDQDTIAEVPTPYVYPDHLNRVDSSVIEDYTFINFRENRIKFFGDSTPNFDYFYRNYDSLMHFEDRQLLFYHIGGSHIQADVYSHDVREYVGLNDTITQAPRGLMFPFGLLGLDYPYNYRVKKTGNWDGVRAVVKKDTNTLGLLGFRAWTDDSVATIRMYEGIENLYYKDLTHTRARIYWEIDTSHQIQFPGRKVLSSFTNYQKGYQEFYFLDVQDTMDMKIVRIDSTDARFTIYGIELMNDNPGVIYNSIGVNGASFKSYGRCQNWEKELTARPPDMFIISIGTNDANVVEFDSLEYEARYKWMIETILKTSPKCAIILTVPNDAYYKRKYPNKHVAKVERVIYKLAAEYGMGVWDMYEIMGGFNSSQTWYMNKLMRKDRVHFTRTGYHIKGDLFIEAWEKFLIEYGQKLGALNE